MKNDHRGGISLFWLLMAIFLFCFLHILYEPHFYYQEQEVIFIFHNTYFIDILNRPGGVTLLLSNFLTQFFIYPYWGPAIVSLLLSLIGIQTSMIVHKIAQGGSLMVLYSVPVLLLFWINLNSKYLLQGTLSYSFLLAAILLYISVNTFRRRIILAVLLTVLLFVTAGTIHFCFVIVIGIWETFKDRKRIVFILLPLLVAILVSVMSVYFCFLGDLRQAFLPDLYYIRSTATEIDYALLFSFPCIILICLFLNKYELPCFSKWKVLIIKLLLIVCFLIIGFHGCRKYGEFHLLRVKRMDYYARNQEWEKILLLYKGQLVHYLELSYLNLALTEKSSLADNIFAIEQQDISGFFIPWDLDYMNTLVLCDQHFSVGNIAEAQQIAFESYVSSSRYGNPRMLKRLVQTNLIYGHYKVAEKYINILEKTIRYKDWASGQRRFLFNDQLIEEDKVLGEKRRALLSGNYLVQAKTMDQRLLDIAKQNPSNGTPLLYAGYLYLLSGQQESFNSLLKEYYGSEIMPVLPKAFQEAVVLFNEDKPEVWSHYNISTDIVTAYKHYKSLLASNHNPITLHQNIKKGYGETYWYYCMRNK